MRDVLGPGPRTGFGLLRIRLRLLDAVFEPIGELVDAPVWNFMESTGESVARAIDMAEGICVLENVRFNPGETKGDPELAAAYAALGDVFVNDAFGSSPRDPPSGFGVARLLQSILGIEMYPGTHRILRRCNMIQAGLYQLFRCNFT